MSKELLTLNAIAAEMETIPGHTGFYYKNLVTGFTFGVREEETYLAASVITSSENVCPRFRPQEIGLDVEVKD